MSFIQKNVKGILLCLVLAIPCWFLGQAVPVVGGPVFGILAGMLITLLLKDKTQFQSGITFLSKKVLQYAVILLGFGLNLSVILETGKQSFADHPRNDFHLADYRLCAAPYHARSRQNLHVGRCRFLDLRWLRNRCNSPRY